MKKTFKYQLKTLTKKEYGEAPEDVRKIYLHVQKSTPISEIEKRRILKAHSYYFTKKVERTFGQNIKTMYRLNEADKRKSQEK